MQYGIGPLHCEVLESVFSLAVTYLHRHSGIQASKPQLQGTSQEILLWAGS
jgi:hypothetical protein